MSCKLNIFSFWREDAASVTEGIGSLTEEAGLPNEETYNKVSVTKKQPQLLDWT
jgi:hypothetical protein